jgi:hypothetical protein
MRALWIAGLLSVLLFAGLAWYLAPLEPSVLRLQLAATPRAFGSIVHAWPAEHLMRFRAHLPVDALLLLAYGAFGYLLATRTQVLAGLHPWVRGAATWALPAAASLDAIENALHWWLTELPRFGVPLAYAVAAAAAGLKWLLILAFALVVSIALARRSPA